MPGAAARGCGTSGGEAMRRRFKKRHASARSLRGGCVLIQFMYISIIRKR